MNCGVTPCQHLRPHSEREHTVSIFNQSRDDDGKKGGKEIENRPIVRHAWHRVDLFYPGAHMGDKRKQRLETLHCAPNLANSINWKYFGRHLRL